MDPSQVTVPPLKDLTIDNITDNVKLINSQCENPRLKYILERVVQHLHDLARETRLSQDEWMQGIEFLTAVGKICTDVRQVCQLLLPLSILLMRPRRYASGRVPDLICKGIYPSLRRFGSVASC